MGRQRVSTGPEAMEGPEPTASGTLPEVLANSTAGFDRLTSPYRRELLVHCYRMLGSIDDAEDAVQDALVRAWTGRRTFRQDISLRAWLYRIATNASLDAIERRRRGRDGEVSLDVTPIPDRYLESTSAGPEARYDTHESISLAFLTVLQRLPPRQRAVLVLRDVLGWRAAEVAVLLEVSESAVNSALHRARTTVARRYPAVNAPAGRCRRRSSQRTTIAARAVRRGLGSRRCRRSGRPPPRRRHGGHAAGPDDHRT